MDVVYEAEDLKLQRHVAPAFERFRFDLGRTRHGLFERFGWGSEDKELGGAARARRSAGLVDPLFRLRLPPLA